MVVLLAAVVIIAMRAPWTPHLPVPAPLHRNERPLPPSAYLLVSFVEGTVRFSTRLRGRAHTPTHAFCNEAPP